MPCPLEGRERHFHLHSLHEYNTEEGCGVKELSTTIRRKGVVLRYCPLQYRERVRYKGIVHYNTEEG